MPDILTEFSLIRCFFVTNSLISKKHCGWPSVLSHVTAENLWENLLNKVDCYKQFIRDSFLFWKVKYKTTASIWMEQQFILHTEQRKCKNSFVIQLFFTCVVSKILGSTSLLSLAICKTACTKMTSHTRKIWMKYWDMHLKMYCNNSAVSEKNRLMRHWMWHHSELFFPPTSTFWRMQSRLFQLNILIPSLPRSSAGSASF